uniref:TBC1 domain family member 2A isoform X2 n=1 Tax=Pristiophorus japonicus TaxID=55135 RepID=UPI00398F7905
MMANELAQGTKSSQTAIFASPESPAAQTECVNASAETPTETDDLANYLQLKSSNKRRALPKKLCGYLNKLGGKGPLKGCKTRWFVYDQKKCHLYYFRTAQDSSPLGSMDLANAVFNYCLEAEEGTFEIKTPEKAYTLKAKNREVMMYWLQQLQQKRWEHDEQNHLLVDSLTISTQHPESPPAFNSEEETSEFLDPVKTPTGFVGETAASLPAPLQPTTLHNISLKHLGTEIQNFGSKTVFQFYGNKPLRENRTSFEEINQGTNEAGEDVSLAKGADVAGGTPEKPCPLSKITCNPLCHPECKLKPQQVKESRQEEQKTPQQKCSGGSLRNLTNLLNSSPLSLEKVAAKDGISPDKVTRLHNDILGLTNELNAQKDDQEAYKTQNKFLNCEIYQITKLWQSTSDHEKTLAMKCAYLEARYCQIESKYLVMLHNLQDNISDQGKTSQEIVKQLIADQLRLEIKDESVLAHGSPCNEYDEYGFNTVSSPVQDEKLLARIHILERKSNNLMVGQEGQEKAIQVKWANHLSGRTCGELVPSPELKNLIRNGIPKEHRSHVWKWCTNRRAQHIRERYGSNRYQELLKLCENKQQAASKQIELDLLRTLTNNRLFTSPTSKMVQQLRRVLLAYSWQNPAIGYCQGLNRLVAIALLVLREEEDAFWCLVAIIDCIMPEDYYSNTLTGSQVDQRVFKDFLSEKLPRLMNHFDQYNVDLSHITFNWFLVVFVDSLPSDILLRVWDAFLYEGTKVIFRYALAIFKYNEEEILKLHDNLPIYEYLRCLTKNISEGRKLMNIAFVEMNPFPLRLLQNRRAAHLEKLNAELSELERIREAYVNERVEQKDSIGGVSEDEEET